MTVKNSRKKSPVTYCEIPLFFSLVDYRNNYFTSSNPDKIIEFYNGFENRDQLIQWMKERPKGVANIHEVEGDKDIIVVIPTADFNGKYAKECRENIFKGLHIIFVESGEVPDPYFNYAHNCNVGIRKAMEYNPKWVVVSNDDMYKVDEITKLREELNKLDHDKIGVAYLFPANDYYSVDENLSRVRITRYLLASISSRASAKNFFNIKQKFNVRLAIEGTNVISKLFYKHVISFKDVISIGIFNPLMLEEFQSKWGHYFDENYINCHEESDLAIRFSTSKWKPANVLYSVHPVIGGTLGSSKIRLLRDQSSGIYLSYKWEILINKMIK